MRPGHDDDVPALVELSLRAWEPVFASVRRHLGTATFAQVYPDWRAAQAGVVARCCRAEETDVQVAEVDGRVIGFVVTARRTEDAADVGEVDLIAVDPSSQGRGVGLSLLAAGVERARSYGVDLVVVATGGDEGHAPARAVYEAAGFRPYPQVRYYRRLDEGDDDGDA